MILNDFWVTLEVPIVQTHCFFFDTGIFVWIRKRATGMTTDMMMVMVFMTFIMETMMKTNDENYCDADGDCNCRLLNDIKRSS